MSGPEPYYSDELVTLYLGDCRSAGTLKARRGRGQSSSRDGIAGDSDTSVRDEALAMWGDRPAIVFGDLMLPPPAGTKLVGIYKKPPDAGQRGAIAGHRRDIEALYWLGTWSAGIGGRSSVYTTGAPSVVSVSAARYRNDRGSGHPHAKPMDIMEELVASCPPGTIADPCAGAGSTLVAARNLGRRAIGVELEERYCERAARRLSQGAFDFGEAS